MKKTTAYSISKIVSLVDLKIFLFVCVHFCMYMYMHVYVCWQLCMGKYVCVYVCVKVQS